MFRNLVSVLRLIGTSKIPPTTPGLSLLLAARPAESQAGPATGSAYARRELGYAWECLQKEAQALLSELLRPGELQANMRDFKTGEKILCYWCKDCRSVMEALRLFINLAASPLKLRLNLRAAQTRRDCD